MPVISESPQPQIPPSPAELKRILHLQVPVIVRLAKRRMALQELLRLAGGGILQFPKPCHEPLELLINNKVIGHGEAVKAGGKLGLRLTRIGGVLEKLDAMRR